MPSTHSALYYHVIFGTKSRAALIGSDWEEQLFAYFGGIVRNIDGKLLAAGAAGDHVHLLISLKPAGSIPDLLRDLKRDSSKWVHETINLRDFAWQDGYGIFSVSVSALDSVADYVLNQREHHRVISFRDEYIKFLERHEWSLTSGTLDTRASHGVVHYAHPIRGASHVRSDPGVALARLASPPASDDQPSGLQAALTNYYSDQYPRPTSGRFCRRRIGSGSPHRIHASSWRT